MLSYFFTTNKLYKNCRKFLEQISNALNFQTDLHSNGECLLKSHLLLLSGRYLHWNCKN